MRSMPHPKLDVEACFPSPESALRVMRAYAPQFMRCPTGHALPHREIWGRCTPLDCCDYGQPGTQAKPNAAPGPYQHEQDILPQGLEGEATKRDVPDVAEAAATQAQAEEALSLMRHLGIRRAREFLHPLPELPVPPVLREVGPRAYVRQRLDDIAPYALEKRIHDLLYHPGERGVAAARELLNRAGYGEQVQASPEFRGPVRVTVNVGAKLPYDFQMEAKAVEGARLESTPAPPPASVAAPSPEPLLQATNESLEVRAKEVAANAMAAWQKAKTGSE